MRNMSFFHTTAQILNYSKTVTRRVGWAALKPGDHFRAIVKGQGLKKGEKVQVLAELECVSNTPQLLKDIRKADRESCSRVINDECVAEGFPNLDGMSFVQMFMEHMGVGFEASVNRIEFKHVHEDVPF